MHGLFLGIDCGTQGSKALLLLDAGSGRTLGLGSAAQRRRKAATDAASRTRRTGWKPWPARYAWPWKKPRWTAARSAPWRFPPSSMGCSCSTPRAGRCARPSSGATPRARRRTASCWKPSAARPARWNAWDWCSRRATRCQAALEQAPLSRAVRPRRATSSCPRLPQPLAHRPRLQRSGRRLRQRLLRRAPAHLGQRRAGAGRAGRTPGGGAAGLIEPGACIGNLRPEAAAALGLAPHTRVACGGGDNMLAAIGTGNIRPGLLTASLGTSGTLSACAEAAAGQSARRAGDLLRLVRRLAAAGLHDEPHRRLRPGTGPAAPRPRRNSPGWPPRRRSAPRVC